MAQSMHGIDFFKKCFLIVGADPTSGLLYCLTTTRPIFNNSDGYGNKVVYKRWQHPQP
jgi:hypothetical protein